MLSHPIKEWLPFLVTAAQNQTANFDAALLGAAQIASNLRQKGFDFQITQYPAPEIEKLGCHAFRAMISGPDAAPAYGFSMGTNDDVSSLALFEAFERHVFRAVLEPDQRSEFSAIRLWTGETENLARRFVVGEAGVYPSTTSGMACHTSYQAALLSACLELYERDVLLRRWFSNRAPDPQIPPKSDLTQWISTLTEPETFKLMTGTYIEASGLPVAVAVLISNHHQMAFIGTGAALTVEEAINKACREALMIWIFDFLTWKELRSLDTFGPENQLRRHHENFEQVETFFRPMAQVRQKIVAPSRPILDSLEAFFQEYDFRVVPIGMNTAGNDEASPVLVRAYSPKAIPLFHGEFPLLLPANFDILKSIKNSAHPY